MPAADIAEGDPAAIVYTSGTTGRSKGAVASHRSVCGFVHVNRFGAALTLASLGIEDPAVVASVTRQTALVTVPLFHASGVYGFVVNQLGSGGKVVLRPGRFDEEDVLRLIDYLDRFIGDLVSRSGTIAQRIVALDTVIQPLLLQAAQREARDAAPDAQDAETNALTSAHQVWRERWKGLRGWFVSAGHEPPQAEVLRSKARSAARDAA